MAPHPAPTARRSRRRPAGASWAALALALALALAAGGARADALGPLEGALLGRDPEALIGRLEADPLAGPVVDRRLMKFVKVQLPKVYKVQAVDFFKRWNLGAGCIYRVPILGKGIYKEQQLICTAPRVTKSVCFDVPVTIPVGPFVAPLSFPFCLPNLNALSNILRILDGDFGALLQLVANALRLNSILDTLGISRLGLALGALGGGVGAGAGAAAGAAGAGLGGALGGLGDALGGLTGSLGGGGAPA